MQATSNGKSMNDLWFHLVTGGTHSGDLMRAGTIAADGRQYADTPGELALVQKKSPQGILYVQLGGGTLLSIAEEAAARNQIYAPAHQFLKTNRANTNFGLAATPCAGKMAYENANAAGLASMMVNGMVRPAIRKCAGNADNVTIVSQFSIAGGTGTGAGIALTLRFTEALQDEIETPIDRIWLVTGAESYTPVGDNVVMNAGANILRLFGATMNPDTHSDITDWVWLTELPILDIKETETRRLLAALQTQAIFSEGVMEHLRRKVSNDDTSVRFQTNYGRILMIRSDYHAPTPEDRVARGAALKYVQQIRQLLATAGRIENIEISITATPSGVDDTISDEVLVNEAQSGVDDPELKSKMDADGADYAVDMTDLVSMIPNAPSTLREYDATLRQMRGIEAQLAEQVTTIQATLDEKMQDVDEWQLRTEEKHGIAIKQGAGEAGYAHAGGMSFKNKADRVADYAAALGNYRVRCREAKSLERQLEAVRNMLQLFTNTLDLKLVQPLKKLVEAMDGIEGEAIANVEYYSLDEVFSALVALDSSDAVRLFLGANTVEAVSLATIVKMLQLERGDAKEIIGAIMGRKPEYTGPFWGLRRRPAEHRRTFIVLPRIKKQELAILQAAAPKDVIVTCADRTAGGLGIVILEVYYVFTTQDIMPKKYAANAKKVLAMERRDLVLPPGDPLWKEGLQMIEGTATVVEEVHEEKKEG